MWNPLSELEEIETLKLELGNVLDKHPNLNVKIDAIVSLIAEVCIREDLNVPLIIQTFVDCIDAKQRNNYEYN